MSEGGEARNHEAIEAELRARSFSVAHVTGDKRKVVFLDVALDAVRRSPDEEREPFVMPRGEPNARYVAVRRSPQGEDREADLPELRMILHRGEHWVSLDRYEAVLERDDRCPEGGQNREQPADPRSHRRRP